MNRRCNYRTKAEHNFFQGTTISLYVFGHLVATGLRSRYMARKMAKEIDTEEKAIAISTKWTEDAIQQIDRALKR